MHERERITKHAWRVDGTLKDFSQELKQGLAEMQSYAQSWASSSEGGLRLIPGPRGEPSRRNEQLSKETCEWRTTFRNLARLVEQAPSLFEDVCETIDCEACQGIGPKAAEVGSQKLCAFCIEEA